MTALALALTLAAAPLPADAPTQAQLEALDQPQLLELHGRVEQQLPRRWPAGLSLGVGIFGHFPSAIVLLVGAAKRDVPTLVTGSVMFAVSAGLMTLGIVLLKHYGRQRDAIYATLSAIDARLDELEHPKAQPAQPMQLAELSEPPPPPNVGGVVITATDGATPLAGVTIAVAGRNVLTDSRGVAAVEGLDPGPLQLTATRDGYEPSTEYASIVSGRRATVSLKLQRAGADAPAKLTGLIRSADDGTPLAAHLDVGGRQLDADGRGVFATELAGGTYDVRITAAGYLPQQRPVTLKAGERAIFNVDLHRETP